MSEQHAPEGMDIPDTSWAPNGWEPSDIGFDDAPFGSVLGDPLMGSPIFDVSVLDAAPGSGSDDAGARTTPQPGIPLSAAALPSSPIPRQPPQPDYHRTTAGREPQPRPASQPPSGRSLPMPPPNSPISVPRFPSRVVAGYGTTPNGGPRQAPGGVGRVPAGYPGAAPQAPSPAPRMSARNPYARVQQVQRPAPSAVHWHNPPRQPVQAPGGGESEPYIRPQAGAPGRPTQPRESQGEGLEDIDKFVAFGVGMVVLVLLMMLFANL